MATTESTVTLSVEQDGPRYQATVIVRRDLGAQADEHRHEITVDTVAEAKAWARGIAQMAGTENFRFLDKSHATKIN